MKKLYKFRSLCAAALAASSVGAPAFAQTALTGATVIDGRGGPGLEDAVILVDDGRIACVGSAPECVVTDEMERVDLTGRYVTPGLVDGHVHIGQTGWLDGRPDGMEARDVYPYPETIAALRADPGRWQRAYLCSGITAVIDPGGQAWTVTEEPAEDPAGPNGVHRVAAGPLITHADERNRFFTWGALEGQPLFLSMDSDEEALENVAYLATIGADAIKVWFLNPTDETRAELEARLMLVGEAADEAGLPMWVHSTQLRNAKVALRAGAEMLVHSIEDEPVDQEFIDLLLANDAVYAPTMIVGENWSRAMAAVAMSTPPEIDDPNNCVDEAILDRVMSPERLAESAPYAISPAWVLNAMIRVGRTNALMDDNLIAIHEAGGRGIVATDAGNPLTLHGPSIYNEMERMQAAGLDPETVIVMATRMGAETMGMGDEIGTIEAGKAADLLVLTEDPRDDVAAFRSLTHVMKAGVLHDQESLQQR